MTALLAAIKRVPINSPGGGGDPALGSHSNPAYSVAVTDDYAMSSRELSKKETESKKLANIRKQQQAEAEEKADVVRIEPSLLAPAVNSLVKRSDTSGATGRRGSAMSVPRRSLDDDAIRRGSQV